MTHYSAESLSYDIEPLRAIFGYPFVANEKGVISLNLPRNSKSESVLNVQKGII